VKSGRDALAQGECAAAFLFRVPGRRRRAGAIAAAGSIPMRRRDPFASVPP